MPTTLFLSGVAAGFGSRPLFSGLDLTLAPSDVVALVGPNGAGKSTLLRIVAGEHLPDAGTVRLSTPDAVVGYLPQCPPAASDSVLAYVRRRTAVEAAEAAYLAAAEALASEAPGADAAFAAALDRWLGLGGADLEHRLAEVLDRVGFAVDMQRPLGSLSGGQAARVSLASILVSRFDVLLLDEPTNNLDAAGRALMIEFVREQSAPVLLAAHDRAFIDDVATSVCELDLPQQAVNLYRGGWSDYREAKALARRHAVEAYAAHVGRQQALDAQADRLAEWARRGRVKTARQPSGGALPRIDRTWDLDKARALDQRAARARRAAGRLPDVEQPRKEWELRYRIAEAPPSAEVVLTLDAVVAAAGGFRVGPVSAQVARGDRVALVGDNGTGKSTLLNCLVGGAAPVSGRLSWGTRVSVGVLDQDRSVVSGDGSLLEVALGILGSRDAAETRRLLATFGLGAEHVDRPAASLSPGERTRAALAVFQGRAVNVLVLDEPTNHADVEAIEQLQGALTRFGGTLLVVTHDRALADALGFTATWAFERRGDAASVTTRSL